MRAVWTLACLVALAGCSDGGTRTTHSRITLTPGLLDFGSHPAGTRRTLALTIANDGKSTLNVSAVRTLNDARQAFVLGEFPKQLATGASANVEVSYVTAAGEAADSATLVVDSDADNASSASVPLVGKTSAPACDDQVRNGDETAVDCGGSCPGCLSGSACGRADDCSAGLGCKDAVCGACLADANCRTGQRCEAGLCTGCSKDADCANGSTCVNGLCEVCPGATGAIDTRTDPKNCGACGNVCPSPVHASAACSAGKCARTPCDKGYFDFDGAATFGCETSCTDRTCRAPDGTSTTLAHTPIPETALGLQDFASGSSLGSAVQTGPSYTHTGVLGESTPLPNGGASELRGPKHRLQGGIDATMH